MTKSVSLLFIAVLFTLSACGDSASQEAVGSIQSAPALAEPSRAAGEVESSPSEAPSPNQAIEESDSLTLSSGVLLCDAMSAIEFPPVDYEVSFNGDVGSNLSYIERNRPLVTEVNTVLEAEKDSLTSTERQQFLTLGLGLVLLDRAMDRWQRALEGVESGEYADDLLVVDEFGFRVQEQVDTVKALCN